MPIGIDDDRGSKEHAAFESWPPKTENSHRVPGGRRRNQNATKQGVAQEHAEIAEK
jgi:hypothetical protein